MVGAGPGLSGSVACRVGDEGYEVVLVGLGSTALAVRAQDLGTRGIAAVSYAIDVTDVATFRAALTSIGKRVGRIDVLHFNSSALQTERSLDLSVEERVDDMALGVGALLKAVLGARPHGVGWPRDGNGKRRGGRALDRVASQGVQKARLRNLVQSIDAPRPKSNEVVAGFRHGLVDRWLAARAILEQARKRS